MITLGVTPDGKKAYAVLAQVNGKTVSPQAALAHLAQLADESETTAGLHEVQDVARIVRRLRG